MPLYTDCIIIVGLQDMDDIRIREATRNDLSSLLAIRNTPSLFEEYLSTASDAAQFWVLIVSDNVVGFARLKLPGECDANKTRPLISDICIASERRSQGLGSAFIGILEAKSWALGNRTIFVGVDPEENPRALDLYKRLGYTQLQEEPYEAETVFHDPKGNPPVKKKYWRIELQKKLDETQQGQQCVAQRRGEPRA